MTIKSISPIPIGDSTMAESPSEETHSHPAPTNLSSLRRSWSAQHLPSFPVTNQADQTGGRASRPAAPRENLPELPSLGAIASKAVFAMDGYDELFGHDKPKDASPPQIDISELPAENSIFEQGSSPQQRLHRTKTTDIPLIPAQTPTNPTSARDSQSSGVKTTSLSAMPVMEAPNVSIPLVRDSFTKPADLSASTPLTEPAKTRSEDIPTHPTPASSRPPVKPEATQPEPRSTTPQPQSPDTPQYTDDDLREALQPIIAPCVDKFLYTPTQGIHTYLEPMLRSTVRRAIAEQMEDSSPFSEASGWDKLAWKMRAAFSSRTYEDIVFDVTKRYQVEEVFLLRPHTRSLISYASHDPSRHAKPAKVQDTVKRIASKTSKTGDTIKNGESSIKWENTRNLMIRRGEHCILAAIVHGPSTAILRADLDYALRQAEERFGKTLQDENDIHLQILQPLLEGCLLIKAPAIPN